jgi:hypothetical protein
MAKKKATKVPEGITSRKTSTGINVTISENGRKIATLRGYNNNQNVQKGLLALSNALAKARVPISNHFEVTDLTPKKRKKKAGHAERPIHIPLKDMGGKHTKLGYAPGVGFVTTRKKAPTYGKMVKFKTGPKK